MHQLKWSLLLDVWYLDAGPDHLDFQLFGVWVRMLMLFRLQKSVGVQI